MNEQDEKLWGPKPEPDPELLARQLNALLDWLRLSSWKPHEAACLIAGVLPPEHASSGIGPWLPGREVWPNRRDSWRKAVKSDIAQIKWFMKEAQIEHDEVPQAWLEFAARQEREPPWLPFAKAHQKCRKYLPSSLREEETIVANEPMKQSDVASLGGKAARDRHPTRIKFYPIVKRMLEVGTKRSKIVAILEEEHGDDAPSPGTIYNWAREINGQ
ncbi:hypothetical protein EI983_08340 [Roseovarius faecimaris]|uniref:Uncharacterized protein n=1 Tax=Roseovarius faecimaris TaxID=2494550 RepID=A0A6I6IQX7_9RHOB|nr:hypothetical protein [Roseovarius faecimaris]QGX98291.1 hypothetical protein EI983_08340 [Roseovarius faecimaris]